MSQACRGVCGRTRAAPAHWGARYRAGQKRCSRCDAFFAAPGLRCPCCGTMLRTRPRGRRAPT